MIFSESSRFMVAGKIFTNAEEAIRYGKKLKGVDVFELKRVEIEQTGTVDIFTNTPVKEAMKKLKSVM